MTSVLEVKKQIMSILQSNITDPNSDRQAKNRQWIYDDIPRADLSPTKYPRISVTADTVDSILHELGSTNQRVTVRLNIQVRTKRGVRYQGSWGDLKDYEFLDRLSLEVVETLRKASTYDILREQVGVFDFRLELENELYDSSIMIKSLTYKAVMRR